MQVRDDLVKRPQAYLLIDTQHCISYFLPAKNDGLVKRPDAALHFIIRHCGAR